MNILNIICSIYCFLFFVSVSTALELVTDFTILYKVYACVIKTGINFILYSRYTEYSVPVIIVNGAKLELREARGVG